jgi:hypothetical protein
MITLQACLMACSSTAGDVKAMDRQRSTVFEYIQDTFEIQVSEWLPTPNLSRAHHVTDTHGTGQFDNCWDIH